MVIHYRARGTVDIGKMFIWSGGGGGKNKERNSMSCWLRSWGDNEPVGMKVGMGGGVCFCCYCWTSEDICCIVGQWSWGILGLGMNTGHH